MPITDRKVARDADVGHETITLAHIGSLSASITGYAGIPLHGNGRIVMIGVRVRAKAADDNTVTLTFKLGTSTVGTVAVPASAAPNVVTSDVNVSFKHGDVLTFDTGAFGGTTPSFTDVTVFARIGKSGIDF